MLAWRKEPIKQWEYFVSDDLIHSVKIMDGKGVRSIPLGRRITYIERYVNLKVCFNILFHIRAGGREHDLLAVIYNASEDRARSAARVA